ncbi:hypothetical protein JCM3765_005156 [Sporobolomyces pararoseus]
MSLLLKLPNEILSSIFGLLKSWDDRHSTNRDAPKEGERLKKWFGKSRIAFGSVNRRLREVGTPFLKNTVTIEQTEGEIFSSLILGGPLALEITTIDFEDDYDSLTSFILDVLPNLPALRTIAGLDQATLTEIMGAGKGVSDVLERGKLRRRRQVFLDTLARMSKWEMEVDAETLETLLSASGVKLRILSISPVDEDDRQANILGNPKSGYMAILARSHQLEELKIGLKPMRLLRRRAEMIHPDALRTPLAFGNSLRSLNLTSYWTEQGITGRILPFVASFPNLTDLALGNDWMASEHHLESLPLRLVHLRRLVIAQSCLLYDVDVCIYQYLLTPNLTSIDFEGFPFQLDGFSFPFEEPQELRSTIPSLRRITFHSPRTGRVPEVYVQTLHEAGIQLVLPSRSSDFDKLISTLDRVDEEEGKQDDPEEEAEYNRVARSRANSQQGDELALRAVEDMSDWISEKVKELRIRNDVDGAKELARRMRGTGDLRRWLE